MKQINIFQVSEAAETLRTKLSYRRYDYCIVPIRGGLAAAYYTNVCDFVTELRTSHELIYLLRKLPTSKSILVLDDIYDTGATFNSINIKLRQTGFTDITFAALFVRWSTKRHKINPNLKVIYGQRLLSRLYYDFPWELTYVS